MTKLIFALIFSLSTSYAWAQVNVLREIQHEINEISILMTRKDLTPKEWNFLRGKACGLLVAIEIVARNDQDKKPLTNGKIRQGKYFDFFPHDSNSLKISQP